MSALDNLNAQVAALQAEDQAVIASINTLNTHVEALQAAIGTGNDAAIQAAADAIQAEVSNLANAVTAANGVPPTP